jgi:hypothetical protein
LSEALNSNPYYRNDALAAAAWAEITRNAPDPWEMLDDRRVPVGHRRALVALLDLINRYRPAWAFPLPPVAPMAEWADRIMRGESETIIDWQFAIAESLHHTLTKQDQDFGDKLYRFYQKVLVMAPDLIRARVMLLLAQGHPDGRFRILDDIGLLREALADPHMTSSVLYLSGRHPSLAATLSTEFLEVFSSPSSVNLDPHLRFYTAAFPAAEIARRALAWDRANHPACLSWLLVLMADPRYGALRNTLCEQLPTWYRDHPDVRRRYWQLAAQCPELDLVERVGLRLALDDPSFLVYLVRVHVPEALPVLVDHFRRNYPMIVRGDGGLEVVQALDHFRESEIRASGGLTDTEWSTFRDIRARLQQVG